VADAEPRSKPTWKRRFAFVAWTAVATVVLLEVVLQVGALFFRGAPVDLGEDVDPDAVRVLAVGDSWVAGAEAPEGQGFVDHLGRELGGLADGRDVQLFNLGRTGANSAHVALTVLDEAPRIRPSLIVVLVGQNNASNFYRVAEVEHRIGAGGRSARRFGDRSRVVKLVRILAANARGGSDYDEAQQVATVIEIPPLRLDDDGQPILDAPLLATDAGQRYLRREVAAPPLTTGDETADAAWAVLYAAGRRDLAGGSVLLADLASALGWSTTAEGPSAPVAGSQAELLARYGAMRLARQERRWRAVRYHAGAAVGYEPRGALSDLASAEAHLLAGDWRTARDLLISAHNRAPGLVDSFDLAARFPDQARNPDLYEVLEYPPVAAALPDYEQADVQRFALFDAEGAAQPQRRWIESRPLDLRIRVDLAVWLLEHGRHDEADALMGVVPDDAGLLPPPPMSAPDPWRFAVARALSTGDRDHGLGTAKQALERAQPLDAPLLQVVAEALSAHEDCDALLPVADQWFGARADGGGYARALAPCMEPAEAAARLKSLRDQWGPLGSEAAWTALVRSGRKPFELLYRDLDLVLEEAEGVGAAVVVVNYPNPSEDHTALRDILADYAASRPVGYVDLWAQFRARHDDAAWAERLGPNGHCNAAGYREMADGILEYLEAEGTVAEAAGRQ